MGMDEKMKRWNQIVEKADILTDHRHDRRTPSALVDALIACAHNHTAQELINAGAALGYFGKTKNRASAHNQGNK